jgi:hypothetical protein
MQYIIICRVRYNGNIFTKFVTAENDLQRSLPRIIIYRVYFYGELFTPRRTDQLIVGRNVTLTWKIIYRTVVFRLHHFCFQASCSNILQVVTMIHLL